MEYSESFKTARKGRLALSVLPALLISTAGSAILGAVAHTGRKLIQFSTRPRIVQQSTSIICVVTTLFFSILPSWGSPLNNSQSQPSPGFGGPQKSRITGLKIVSPTQGCTKAGSDVQVKVAVNRRYDLDALKAKLNGKDISSLLQASGCKGEVCFETGVVTTVDGLKAGRNSLFVAVRGGEHHRDVDVDRSVFRFQDGTLLGDSDGIDRYEPVSVGISTVGNGGNGSTWINITTGYTQGVTDSVTNYPQLTDKDETATHTR